MSISPASGRRILDVALRYRAGATPLQNGHFTIYHDDLRHAALRLGHELVILAGVDSDVADGVVPCLTGDDPAVVARDVEAQVRPQDVVMVYEGSLPLVDAFVPLARRRPDVTFVVNLFRPEVGIDAPADLPAQQRVPTPGHPPTSAAGRRAEDRRELPDNLRVTGETPERVSLARAAGLPVRAAWALHSTVATIPPPVEGRPAGLADGTMRVLVPLRAGGFDPEPVADIAHVVRRLGRLAGPGRVRFSVTRQETGRLAARVRGDRLARLGVEMVEPGEDATAYAALIAAHDAVWLPGARSPAGFSYRTQSSGKTLDALLAGVPVVGVAGTTPAREPLRWTQVPLGYRSREEAAAVLLGLLDQHQAIARRLEQHRDDLRSAHGPEATIRRVLQVATAAAPAWDEPILDRDPDLAPDAGLAPVAALPSARSRSEVLVASLAAWRVARIPVSRRAWYALRGRLSRIRAALVRGRPPARPSSP